MSQWDQHYTEHDLRNLDPRNPQYQMISQLSALNNFILQQNKTPPIKFDHTNCFRCAIEKRDPEAVKKFFLNWPKAKTQTELETPMSTATMWITSQEDLCQFTQLTEPFNAFIPFLKTKFEYVAFYAARSLNVLTRTCTGCVMFPLITNEELGTGSLTTKTLFENLINVLYEQVMIEKREALLCLSNFFKTIGLMQKSDNDPDMYKLAHKNLFNCDVLGALIHCLKLINISQFRVENGDRSITNKRTNERYTLLGSHYVDYSKYDKGSYQELLLTRNLDTVDEQSKKLVIVDFQRSLAKTLYRFSIMEMPSKIQKDTRFKEFFGLILDLFNSTEDYATHCYTIGCVNNLMNEDSLIDLVRNVAKEKFSSKTIIFDDQKLKTLDLNGWKKSVPRLDEYGWKPQTKWLTIGTLETKFFDTDLRLVELAKVFKSYLKIKDVNTFFLKPTEKVENASVESIEKKLQNIQISKTVEPSVHQSTSSPQEKTPQQHQCSVCGKAATKKCSQCLAAVYCSVECQKKAWPTHKQTCKKK